jgi:transcription antitermination factor NusG
MEGLIYVPATAYEAKTGKGYPYEEEHDVLPHPAKPAGVPWEEEDLPTRLPRLWAEFHDGDTTASDAPPPAAPAGPRVRVIDGPLRNQEGVLVETDESAGQVTVMVPLFGRPTKVRLKRTQIEVA